MNYLEELNDVQRQAVTDIQGPVMIIAGPGSGKTRVLTYRVAYMLEQGIDAFNILCLTFTNKAAKEMRERVMTLVGGEARNLWMGTFHSVFARILRVEGHRLGYPNHFTIYDTDDSKTIIRNLVKDMIPPDKQKLYKENYIYNRISSAKNSLITPQDYEENADLMSEDESNFRGQTYLLYKAYAQQCFSNGAMDFDDLLIKTWELFKKFPDVAYKYQNKFRYMMIDEFQDTNFAQYEIIKILATVNENLCVVGDDAQSIYAFRGATIQNILDFEKQYPDLKKYKLEQNYRSTTHIVAAANSVISNNLYQIKKTIFTERAEGKKIKEIQAATDNDEGKLVADQIMELKLRNQLYNKDVVILYRTNSQSRAFEEALRKRNIAYKIYGGISFYQRKEIKDFLSYLRVIINPNDAEALKRIINYPVRGIGNTTINKLIVQASEQGITLWEAVNKANQLGLPARAATDLEAFAYLIKNFQTMLSTSNAYEVATYIAKQTGIQKELHNDKSAEGISRFENLTELLNSIKEFTESNEVIVLDDEVLDNDRSLGSYLQQITLITDADRDESESDVVKLMTIHASKGLEFKAVFIVGLEENLFPSILSISSRYEMEEERRLFYVAITRAKDYLYLCNAKSRYRFGRLEYGEPSRFLEEIADENFERVFKKSSLFADKPKAKTENITNIFSKNLSQKFNPNAPKPIADSDFKADDVSTLKEKDQVLHQKFGSGIVSSIEGSGDSKIATISFREAGEKRIMLKYAKLKFQN